MEPPNQVLQRTQTSRAASVREKGTRPQQAEHPGLHRKAGIRR
jgi:hypothetical protein